MGMNREPFETGGFYHIYNRGTDKRSIFHDHYDVNRFLKSMDLFNSVEPIGSLYQLTFEEKSKRKKSKKLVDIIAYCLNPNHYHLILRQRTNRGISEFMKRLNGGYTWYFNYKTDRSGYLFQGAFKSKYVDGNDYLLRLSAYVNLNDKVHKLSGATAKFIRSSWQEYISGELGLCEKKIIQDQFTKKYSYREFALEALPQMLQEKQMSKELRALMLD